MYMYFFFILNFVVRQILTVRRGTVGRGRILFSVFFLFPFSIRFFFFLFPLKKRSKTRKREERDREETKEVDE